jgi:hypothetical protein
MKSIQTNSTLDINYIPNQSLVLKKNKIEGINQGKHYFWVVLSIVLFLIVLGSSFLLLIEELLLLPSILFFFIMTFIGFIISISRSLKKYFPQTAYFFDEVKFQPNQIEFTKSKETKILAFEVPYLIHLVVNQSEIRTRIDLEYFGQRLLTFQIEKIEDLPKLTDGLCDLYHLDLVDFFEFDEKEQILDFYSKEDKSVTTFIDINQDETTLIIDLSLDNTKLQFLWSKNILTIDSQLIMKVLAIDEIQDIIWHFETEDDNRTCYIYILDQQGGFTFELSNLSQKSNSSVFQTALQFIKILKSKEELEDREIGISGQYCD